MNLLKQGISNIKGSLKTTIAGAVLCLFSGIFLYKKEFNVDLVSVETVIFGAGVTLFFLKDKYNEE